MALELNRWWDANPSERFWLEITDRDDLGENLAAPQTQDRGAEYWSYSLVREVRPGDIVLHYHKPAHAITSWSVATGSPWEEDIVWAAHGTSARSQRVKPYPRPGLRLKLENFTRFQQPISLEVLRAQADALLRIKQELTARHGDGLYLPFAFSTKRPLRLTQCYLAKLPAAAVQLLNAEGLGSRDHESSVYTPRHRPPARVREVVGSPYRAAVEDPLLGDRDPFEVDPAVVERGLRGHATTQNALADHLRSAGLTPLSPSQNDPPFDLAWTVGYKTFVAEIKSITAKNQEKQLRLGLGQVLHYRHLLAREGREVAAVLVAERRPSDESWVALCRDLGVRLIWPDCFEEVVSPSGH